MGVTLLLAGCSQEKAVVTFQPSLSCPQGVKCHVYEWFVGIRYGGANIGGTHVECKCIGADQ